MSIYINLNLDHPFFREPLRVGIKWAFPFLPRIGESINPWIWIEGKEIKLADIKLLLSAEGEYSLNAETLTETFTLNDWLYEVGIDCDCICGISYYKNDKVTPHEIYVNMFLNETGKLR